MGLNLDKLENVKEHGSHTTAQCPACAEMGDDRKGDHLFITDSGQFGCVLYPGDDGQIHRKRIFELVGVKDIPAPKPVSVKKIPDRCFKIRNPLSGSRESKIIQKNILGHLGHIKSTHARKNINTPIDNNNQEDLKLPVPSDPEPAKPIKLLDLMENKYIMLKENEYA